MEKEKLILTVMEAAEILGVSKISMYNVIHSESCDFAFNVGRRIVISRPAFERWIERRAKEGIRL